MRVVRFCVPRKTRMKKCIATSPESSQVSEFPHVVRGHERESRRGLSRDHAGARCLLVRGGLVHRKRALHPAAPPLVDSERLHPRCAEATFVLGRVVANVHVRPAYLGCTPRAVKLRHDALSQEKSVAARSG